MLSFFFSDKPAHQRLVRRLAILWTCAIVVLCFLPSDEIPDTRIPFMDKWAHFIMFGLFSFLWLASIHNFKKQFLIIVFLISVIFGWLVEVLQGQLSFLGRSKDNMDVLADAVGGFLGVVVFYIGYTIIQKKKKNNYGL